MLEKYNLIIEHFVEARCESVHADSFSNMMDQLIWVLDQDKINIGDILESWLLNADDKFKVEVALGVKEFFPIKEKDDNQIILSAVKQKWPDLTESCDLMLAGYPESSN